MASSDKKEQEKEIQTLSRFSWHMLKSTFINLLFLLGWSILQGFFAWCLDQILNIFPLGDMDSVFFLISQLIFSIMTLVPLLVFIYVDSVKQLRKGKMILLDSEYQIKVSQLRYEIEIMKQAENNLRDSEFDEEALLEAERALKNALKRLERGNDE